MEHPERSAGLGWRRALAQQELAPLIAIVVLFIVFETRSGVGFFTSSALMSSVAALTASVGMVSLGVTALMISGEFDLSHDPTATTCTQSGSVENSGELRSDTTGNTPTPPCHPSASTRCDTDGPLSRWKPASR